MKNSQRLLKPMHGLSLIELMVAMTIGLILIAAIGQLYISSKRSYNAQDSLGRLQEAGRYVMDLLTYELRQAGYYGENIDIATISGSHPPLFAPEHCPSGDDRWGRLLGNPLFALNDTTSGYDCIKKADYLRGDILTVRYASAAYTLLDNSADQRLMMRTLPWAGRLFSADLAQEPSNQLQDSAAPRLLLAHAYYIAPSHDSQGNNRSCLGHVIPALARKYLDNSGRPRREELVSGVENLQAELGLDANSNGSIDTYVTADQVSSWDNVLAVRLWILLRHDCPDHDYKNTQVYHLGAGQDYQPNDAFRRQLYSTTIRLRNRS